MKFNHLIRLVALMGSAAMAHDHPAAASHAMPDAKAIEHRMKKLSMFEDVVKVDQAQHGAHGAHGAHDAHASHPKH